MPHIHTPPAENIPNLPYQQASTAGDATLADSAECLLGCVLATSPSAGLTKRYAGLNRLYREMTAPHMLQGTGYLLPDCQQTTAIAAPLPLTPLFASQRALQHASARDVSWVNLTWQMPTFYGEGLCEVVMISADQHDQLSESLIRQMNGTEPSASAAAIANDLLATMTAPRSTPRSTPISQPSTTPISTVSTGSAQNANVDAKPLLIVRAKATVTSLSLHYNLSTVQQTADQPDTSRPTKPTTEYVTCRVLPLRQTRTAASATDTDTFPFIGIPLVSFELCGPFSEPDPIEAQLFTDAARQAQDRRTIEHNTQPSDCLRMDTSAE